MDAQVLEQAVFTVHGDGKTSIPKWIREKYGLKQGDKLHIKVEGYSRPSISSNIPSTESQETKRLIEARLEGKKIVDQERVEKGALDEFPKEGEKEGLKAVEKLKGTK